MTDIYESHELDEVFCLRDTEVTATVFVNPSFVKKKSMVVKLKSDILISARILESQLRD